MTILAIVNAEKEGQIESKMMKVRQMDLYQDPRPERRKRGVGQYHRARIRGKQISHLIREESGF